MKGAGRRMGGEDRRGRNLEHLPEGIIRYVRNVDDHAEAVYLGDRLPTERRKSAVAGLVGR